MGPNTYFWLYAGQERGRWKGPAGEAVGIVAAPDYVWSKSWERWF